MTRIRARGSGPGRFRARARRIRQTAGASRARALRETTRRSFLLVLPGLWVAAILGWEFGHPGGVQLLQLLAAAPAIACAGTGRRMCVVLGGLCAVFALVPLGSVTGGADPATRLGTCAAILAVVVASYLTAGRRARLLRDLVRTREIAEAAQRVVLRPLPARVGALGAAARHRSATEGAAIGGDLYDVVATRYGVRAVIGDVRGHGMEAIGTVAAVLGSFREAAHDEDGLPDVLRRLERALSRHLAERAGGEPPGAVGGTPSGAVAEEFVTVLLLEVSYGGEVTALNCGHPWPYRFDDRCAVPLAEEEPLPPLGLFPLPAALPPVACGFLERGAGLLLHTDGAPDTRNAHGEFFPLRTELLECLAGLAEVTSEAVVADVHERLVRHAGGRLTDDVALLALTGDHPRVPVVAGAAAGPAGTCPPQPRRPTRPTRGEGVALFGPGGCPE